MIDVYVSQPHYWRHLEPILERDVARRMHGGTSALSGRVFATRQPWARREWQTLNRRGDVSPLVLTAGFQDALAVLRVGRRPILLEHGAGQTYADARYHPSYPGGQHREAIELFLCTNAGVAQGNVERYPDIPAEIIGSPSLDYLDDLRRRERIPSDVGAPVLGLAWHWPCKLTVEAGWAFPEWGSVATLRRLVDAWPGPVYGTSHPRSLLAAARWYEAAGIEVVPEWRDLVRYVDVMSVDNSSVLFEAAALGVPVVLVNSRTWRRHVDHGLRFWEWSEIGPSIWPTGDPTVDGDTWADAAWEAYDEPERYEGYARDMADVLYPHRGEAADRAVDALAAYLDERISTP